jgi:predicted transcriptional regulator
MTTLSIRLPQDLEQQLEQEARAAHKSRSEVVRDALAEYVRRRERERFMAELVNEASRLRDDPEVAAVEEEFLPLENEILEVAEGGEPGDRRPGEPERWWR